MAEDNKLSRAAVLTLGTMVITTAIMANDFSSMNVALPDIEKDFDTDLNTVQWVINAFILGLAVLTITGGRLADIYGRKQSYFIGMSIFALASFFGGFAPNIYLLISARVIMGIGAAIVLPAIVGILYHSVPDKRAGLAGALFAGSIGVGEAIGPILGGGLTTFLRWRWIFFFNVPVSIIAMFLAWRVVQRDPVHQTDDKIDYLGSVVLALGLFGLLFTLDQTASWGWGDPRTLALLVGSLIVLAIFVVVERRVGEWALIPHDIMIHKEFRLTVLSMLLLSMPFFVSLMYIPQITQKFLGFSAFEAGIGLLPLVVTFAFASFFSSRLYDKVGPKLAVAGGAGFLVLGSILLTTVPDDVTYIWLVPGMLIIGIGIGIFFSSATTAGVTLIDSAKSSLAGGILFMGRVVGAAIGIALTTAIFTTFSENKLGDELNNAGFNFSDETVSKLDGLLINTDTASGIISGFSSSEAAQILSLIEDAFMIGYRSGMLVNAIIGVFGFLIVLFFVGGPFRIKELEEEERAARDSLRGHLHHPHSS